MSIYDIKVQARDGSEVSMETYKGKVLLIVNTATGCGFTHQYDELQAMYDEFAKEGLEILDFPCNQFGEQAPGSDEEIHSFCTGRFGITFPQFAKIEVNGDNASPLYKWLYEQEGSKFEGFDKNPMGLMLSGVVKKMDKDYKKNNAIKWNFTKFLVSREGEVIGRFEPMNSMKKLKEAVQHAL